MSWNLSDNKLFIRIERGRKPRLKVDETGRTVHAVLPNETNVNWPPIKTELSGGYTITIQRLQQQYKISVQHLHEKKPEIVVYSTPCAYDNELKTVIKEMNTQINDVGIAGPNLDVLGNIKCQNITFESTVGTLHINARILSNRLVLLAQSVVISTESLLSTRKFRSVSRKLQLDGRLYAHECSESPRHLSVVFDSNLVHLGVDGCIGESNDKENNKLSNKKSSQKASQITVDTLSIQITGSLANYGRIISLEKTELKIGDSLLSLSDGTIDSAGRGYDALKGIRGVRSRTACAPSSASLRQAITSQNANEAAHLIENGVDLNDQSSRMNRRNLTLRQEAIKKYHEKKGESLLNKNRANITLINALFTIHDWKRGTIQSSAILAVIGKRCDDCAQFSAQELQMKIGSSATVEKDSIWSSSWIEMEVGADMTILGQVKHKTLIVSCVGTVRVTQTAIINHEIFARINSKNFDCDGIWSIGETFVIDSSNNITFYSNSYIESEKMEIGCEGNVVLRGSWQVGTLWMKVADMFDISNTAKVFTEENVTITAKILKSQGFFNSVESCQMQIHETANFLPSSKLECRNLNLISEGNCVLAGIWMVNQLNVYVRKNFSTLEGAKCAIFTKATVTTGSFRNDSLWQIENDGLFTIGRIEQSSHGTLFIKQTLDLVLHSESSNNWDGRIVCSRFLLRCLKLCKFDGFLRANEAEVTVPYPGESQMHANGQWDILAGPLTVKGNSSYFSLSPKKKHPFPAFILSGRLSATAIIAPFTSIEISENSITRLIGLSSPNPEIEFNVLIAAGSLTTGKNSTIVSLAKNPSMEGIICAETWFHEGQIRFQAQEVHLLANSWIQNGRLTNCQTKENHLQSARVVVEELLLNKGTIACDCLQIIGEGMLENHGRIFASENMDISLKNFDNDQGSMESKNSMKLLSASRDWTRLSGSIKAKTDLQLCAHKLEFAVKDATSLSREGRLSFSAKNDLFLSTPIVDENHQLALGCAAQRSIIMNAKVEIDRLEVLLGGSEIDATLLHLRENADVYVNNLIITGSSKEIQICLEGKLRCGRLSISSGFQKVTLTGRGFAEIDNLQADKSDVLLDLIEVASFGHITANAVEILSQSILRLKPYGESDSSTILTPNLNIKGNLLVDGKLFITALKGSEIYINGSIVGSSPESEVCIEGIKLRLTGLIASLKFLEIFAKETLTITNGKFKNINGSAIECKELFANVNMDDCLQSVWNSEVANISGKCISSTGSDILSIFSSTIQSSINCHNMQNLTIGCSRSAYITGSLSSCKKIEFDAKWLTSDCKITDCENVTCSAWSLHIKSPIEAAKIELSSLGVVLLTTSLTTPDMQVVGLFVLSPNHSLPTSCVHSLLLISPYMETAPTGLSYLHFMIGDASTPISLSPSELTAWKEAATMMKDRFSSTSIDADELLLGLKYLSDLRPSNITLNVTHNMYQELDKMIEKFNKSPINFFSSADLVAIIYSSRNTIIPTANEKIINKKSKKKSESLLFSVLSRFRSAKYDKNCRASSDSDGGYASRSSSEDLDIKEKRVSTASPTQSIVLPLFEKDHMERIDRTLEEADNSKPNNAEQISESFLEEEEELLQFEELEQEICDAENGIVRTDYIICHNHRIQLARIKQKLSLCSTSRPQTQFPIMRVSSSNDLVMKRIKVKNALSSLDLRSFGSEISLLSLDFSKTPDVGSPIHYPSSPLQRSRIPRGSFRSPCKMQSPCE
ncbi:unnamed protein product [Auanema sp. JU1783]|nr:unnamed protein product [Auanema sp. JU1783]